MIDNKHVIDLFCNFWVSCIFILEKIRKIYCQSYITDIFKKMENAVITPPLPYEGFP